MHPNTTRGAISTVLWVINEIMVVATTNGFLTMLQVADVIDVTAVTTLRRQLPAACCGGGRVPSLNTHTTSDRYLPPHTDAHRFTACHTP